MIGSPNQLVPKAAQLLVAASRGDTAAVRELLAGLTPEQRMPLLNHANEQGDTALMLAARWADTDVIRALLEGLTPEQRITLNHATVDGYTALMWAADRWRADADIIRALLEGLTPEQRMPLLNHATNGGGTVLKLAAYTGDADAIQVLLDGLTPEQRITLLNHADNRGGTALMWAARNGHIDAIGALLDGLTPEERRLVLAHNDQGRRAIIRAFEAARPGVVELLQGYGVQLPAHLRQGGEELNDRQSTHTATVHDSLARSAIKLVARYLTLNAIDKKVLLDWADCPSAAQDEPQKMRAMLTVMDKEETQNKLGDLINTSNLEIHQWQTNLALDDSNKKAVIARSLNRIATAVDYKEPRTHLTLPQVLALVWRGVQDRQFFREVDETNEKDNVNEVLTERLDAFIKHLYMSQREYNLDSKDNDTDPQADDDEACDPGTFNQLIHTLATLHDDVTCIMVNYKSVRFKACAHITSECKNLTEQDYAELKENFDAVLYSLPNSVKDKIRPIVLAKLNEEYGEFVQARLIKPATLTDALNNALDLLLKQTIRLIQSKLDERANATASTSTSAPPITPMNDRKRKEQDEESESEEDPDADVDDKVDPKVKRRRG